jgi:hypothetical protein
VEIGDFGACSASREKYPTLNPEMAWQTVQFYSEGVLFEPYYGTPVGSGLDFQPELG